jgi:ribosome-associated toxin RatA of RatAB toxin-antitoxin module
MEGGLFVATVERTHIFNGSVEKVFAGLCRYDKYPEYLPGVTEIAILPSAVAGSTCQVRYDINLIKKFFYILNMWEDSGKKLYWNLAESNLMKLNSGSWVLKPGKKGTTEAAYSLEVKFRGFVPSAVSDRIAQANLPMMFAGFQQLIDSE